MTTHTIEEAERLCDRIAFVVAGKIVAIDTVEHLIQPIQDRYVVQIAFANGGGGLASQLAEAFTGLAFQMLSPGLVRVEAAAPIPVGPLVRFLEERGAEVSEARRMRPSLEDVFVTITGIEAGAMAKEKEKAGAGGMR